MAARNRMLQKKWKDRIKVKRVDISERIEYNIKERKEELQNVRICKCMCVARTIQYLP